MTGKVFGGTVVGEWAHNLSFHSTQVGGRFEFKEALDEFTQQVGWIIGLGDVHQLEMRTAFLPFGMQSGITIRNDQ